MGGGDSYKELELQIARILRLLEGIDAEVRWNERIPDPDNPVQERQVDISIRRAKHLTLVECRAWKAPQDVTWIEELHGRRDSLNADSVIGVSSSGFTQTALLKGQRLGVILRDFQTLSAEEIRTWGEPSSLTLIFHEFRDVLVNIALPCPWKEEDGLRITGADGEPIPPRAVLMSVAERHQTMWNQTKFVGFLARIDASNQRVNGVAPLDVSIRGRMRTIKEHIAVPSVCVYGDAGGSPNLAEARVERFGVGQSQIVHGSKECVLVFDMSRVVIPKHCVFASPLVSNLRGLQVRNVEFIGFEKCLQSNVDFKYLIRWQEE